MLPDGDGDGVNTLAEYRAGINPGDATSAPWLETATNAGGRASVKFTAAPNQAYTVEWNSSVAGGSWQKLSDIVAQPADRLETVINTITGEGARSYRVVTPRRPWSASETSDEPCFQGGVGCRRDSCLGGVLPPDRYHKFIVQQRRNGLTRTASVISRGAAGSAEILKKTKALLRNLPSPRPPRLRVRNPPGCGRIWGRWVPVVSLRSTTGYTLASLRDGVAGPQRPVMRKARSL